MGSTEGTSFAVACWGCTVAVLGFLHVIAARFWHDVFARSSVAAAEPVPQGYRLGTAVLWRLPARAAALELGISAAVFLAGPATAGAWRVVLLAGATSIILAAWLVLPPGMRGRIPVEGGPGPVLERRLGRSLAVLALVGLLPALTIGAPLAWLSADVLLAYAQPSTSVDQMPHGSRARASRGRAALLDGIGPDSPAHR